jgi:diguanylate cyclase (GGDEF)-like protein
MNPPQQHGAGMTDQPNRGDEEELPRILLVDDAPENLQLLRHLLRRDSTIEFVDSGDEAIAVASRQRPDLVLVDANARLIDGYDICRRLKADLATQDIPVIFVTERETETDEAKGLGVGALDYIARPLSSPVLYTRIVNHLGVARANADLKRLATTDSLTGVSNRRHFLELAGKEIARMRRYQTPCSCLMLDIDHFKQVNDSFGHDVGDQAIIATARAAQQTLRTEDLFGRIGGEEFAGMLPMTALDQAATVAERLRLAIAAIRIPTKQSELRFTASIGLTAIPLDEDSFDVALKRADEGLYAAKHNGRNRVVVR